MIPDAGSLSLHPERILTLDSSPQDQPLSFQLTILSGTGDSTLYPSVPKCSLQELAGEQTGTGRECGRPGVHLFHHFPAPLHVVKGQSCV